MARRPDSELEFPDLELDTSAVRAKPAAPATSEVAPGFGTGGFDPDDFDLAGDLPLELGAEPDTHSGSPVARGVTETGRAWPTGSSPDRGQLGFEPLELATLAAYGAAPASLHLSPLYTWRVLSAQRALRARLVTLDRELADAEARRDDELGRLVHELRPLLSADTRFAGLLQPLGELDQEVASGDRALASAQAERTAELDRIAVRRQNVQRDLAVRRDEEQRASAAHAERQHQLARVEAQHKRVLIEIRSIEELAQRSVAPGSPMPPELAVRHTAERGKLAAIEPELAARREAERAAGAALTLARQKLDELERELAAVDAAGRAVDERHRAVLATLGQSARHAADRRRLATADVGRAVLATRGGVPVSDELLDRVVSADAEVERLAKESEKHLRALDAFDRAAFDRGRNLALGLAAAFVLLVLLALLL